MAARKFASVKLTSAFIDEARKEAGIVNRSVGGQIEHWARLGKALESAPGMPVSRVREALEGKVALRSLSRDEQEAVLDQMHDRFKIPTDDEIAAYAALADLPGAVGLDEKGRLVQRPLKPRLRKAS